MHAYMRIYYIYREETKKRECGGWEGVDQGQNFYICVYVFLNKL